MSSDQNPLQIFPIDQKNYDRILRDNSPSTFASFRGAIRTAVKLTLMKSSRRPRRHLLIIWKGEGNMPTFKLGDLEIDWLASDGKVKLAGSSLPVGTYTRLVEYGGAVGQCHMVIITLYPRFS